jgi:hypothetical protein
MDSLSDLKPLSQLLAPDHLVSSWTIPLRYPMPCLPHVPDTSIVNNSILEPLAFQHPSISEEGGWYLGDTILMLALQPLFLQLSPEVGFHGRGSHWFGPLALKLSF